MTAPINLNARETHMLVMRTAILVETLERLQVERAELMTMRDKLYESRDAEPMSYEEHSKLRHKLEMQKHKVVHIQYEIAHQRQKTRELLDEITNAHGLPAVKDIREESSKY